MSSHHIGNLDIYSNEYFSFPYLGRPTFDNIMNMLGRMKNTFTVKITGVYKSNIKVPENVNITIGYGGLDTLKTLDCYERITIENVGSEILHYLPKQVKIKIVEITNNVDLSGYDIEEIHVKSDYTLGTCNTIRSVNLSRPTLVNNLDQHEWIDTLKIGVDIVDVMNYEKITNLYVMGNEIRQRHLDKILENKNIEYLNLYSTYKSSLWFTISDNLKELSTIGVAIQNFSVHNKLKENIDRLRFKKVKPIMN